MQLTEQQIQEQYIVYGRQWAAAGPAGKREIERQIRAFDRAIKEAQPKKPFKPSAAIARTAKGTGWVVAIVVTMFNPVTGVIGGACLLGLLSVIFDG